MRTQEHLISEIILLKSLSVTVCKQDFSEQKKKHMERYKTQKKKKRIKEKLHANNFCCLQLL